VVRVEAYLPTKWHRDPSSRLATIDMGRKLGGGCAPLGREGGSPSNNVARAEAYPLPSGILIHPAVWPQQTWAKNWGLCPFWGGRAGSPSEKNLYSNNFFVS